LRNYQGTWFTANMAGRAKEPGPTSVRTARNLKQVRQERGVSYAELSRRLKALLHPILDTGIMKIEKGERRVDVDDLVALALALGVTPNTLILPGLDIPGMTVTYALTPAVAGNWVALWQWAQGERHPGIPIEGAHSWLGDGEHPDLLFSLNNRPYLTSRTLRDEIADSSARRLPEGVFENLLAAVLRALAAGADPTWVRRVVELALYLPDTASPDDIRDLIAARLAQDSEP
jgi:transcriptional regulator with XRE-family HTH domain